MGQILHGKILEDEIPVYVVTFATQEILLFRNAKTGEVVVGAEDRVEQCHYAAVITRVEEELDNELTGGWKIVEVRPAFLSSLYSTLSSASRWVGDPLVNTCSRPHIPPPYSKVATHHRTNTQAMHGLLTSSHSHTPSPLMSCRLFARDAPLCMILGGALAGHGIGYYANPLEILNTTTKLLDEFVNVIT